MHIVQVHVLLNVIVPIPEVNYMHWKIMCVIPGVWIFGISDYQGSKETITSLNT